MSILTQLASPTKTQHEINKLGLIDLDRLIKWVDLESIYLVLIHVLKQLEPDTYYLKLIIFYMTRKSNTKLRGWTYLIK